MSHSKFIHAIVLGGVALLAMASRPALCAGVQYKGASGDAVKGFGTRSLEDLKGTQQPKLIYFYDSELNHNTFAEKMEGKKYLGNEDVQAAIKSFTRLKVNYDGTAPKGWPEAMRERAKNSAAILLMSSDNVQQIWFDQHTSPDVLNSDGIIAAVKAIVEYDKAHKPADDKDKDKDKVASKGGKDDPNALKIKGLPVAQDDKDNKNAPPAPPVVDGKKKATGPKDE